MPTLTKFQCYSCGQTLQVDSSKGGQKAPCPACGTVLTVPVASTEAASAPATMAAAPAPTANAVPPVTAVPQVTAVAAAPVVTRAVDDDVEDLALERGGKKKKKSKPGPNWLMTRIGLLVVFIGLCLVCLVVLFDQIGMLLHMLDEVKAINSAIDGKGFGERPSDAWKTLLKISGIMFLVIVLVSYVGNILSLFGPRTGAVIAAAVAALVVAALAWLLYLLFHLLPLFDTHIVKYETPIRFEGTTKADFERAESQMRGREVVLQLCYRTLPTVFLGLMFGTSALAMLVMARYTRSRWGTILSGTALGLFVVFVLPGFLPPIFVSIKYEDIKTVRTMLWLGWIAYWLGFLAEFVGLACTATAAFMTRLAAR